MSLDPTGTQIRLVRERNGHVVTADIAQVGASLRGLTVHGVDCIARYPLGTRTPAASGVVLVPWPNRIRDGRWEQNGKPQQLAISEPMFNNAAHGLLRYTPYTVSVGEESVTLRETIFPQSGYPYLLETVVTYALTDDGLIVTHQLRNSGTEAAPVAIGTHPYLALGDAPAADLTLTSSGSTIFTVDERLLPTGTIPVPAEFDLRAGRRLSELQLDTAYTDLDRDADGIARHTLRDATGNTVTLWQDENFEFVQFYTSDDYPGRDVALACEPMTAPADAFNSGVGLRWIDVDDSLTATWGITFASA